MAKLMDGKVAVVTGGGGAIGGEIAKLMAAHGASVIVNDLGGAVSGDGNDEKPARDIVATINDAGGKAMPHFGSVAERKDAEDMIKTAVDAFGKVDVIVMGDQALVAHCAQQGAGIEKDLGANGLEPVHDLFDVGPDLGLIHGAEGAVKMNALPLAINYRLMLFLIELTRSFGISFLCSQSFCFISSLTFFSFSKVNFDWNSLAEKTMVSPLLPILEQHQNLLR